MPIITGLPTLSLTLIGAMSMLRMRSEIFFLVMKGLTQKYPVSRNVPWYSPKKIITRA